MSNRICNTALEVRKLSHVEAEVWVRVEVTVVSPTTELRGKLHGPRCPGMSTVEIAYPFQLMARDTPSGTVLARTLIDEPNLWTEKTPFVYEGAVELWEDGQLCDRSPVSVGLKMA